MTKRTLGSGFERLEDRSMLDATGLIDIPAVRLIAEHTHLQLHAELGASIWTSWERHGTSGTGGILRSIGTGHGNPGSSDNPSATDAFVLQFDEPITRPTTVKLWTEGVAPTSVYAWVNSAQWRIDGAPDGTIHIDASEQAPINNLSILSASGGRYGIDYLEIEGDPEPDPGEFPDQEEEILPEPATKTFIDIPTVRTIGEHASIQLMPGLSAEVWTSWERHGTSGTGGILRSIGTGHGNPGSPDNPSATDAFVLQFNTPITRPTTVHLWSDVPASLAQAYVWVNSAARRVNSSPDGTVFIDASDQNPITNLSILSSSGGKYGIDSFEIENGPPEAPKEGSMRILSGNNHRLQIEYSSTADSTTFDIRKNLASGQSFGAVTIQHPGGIVNGTVELEPNWDTFGNWQVSGMFSVNMKDGATNRKLDRSFAAMSWNGQTISPVNDEPPSVDPESIREYEGEPNIAMESDGRKVFAWFASPYDSSYVEIVQNAYSLEPVQLTGSATVEHPGGTAGGFVQLAIPANIPANATLIARVWDRQFSTLLAEQSFAQNEPIPTENRWDGMPPKTELVESLGNLEGNILNIQEQRLMDDSGLITPQATVEERLHAAYPGVWPEDLAAEVERLYQLNPNFTRGHYEQSIIEAQFDMWHQARDDYYDYLEDMAPLIRRATQFWAAAFNGDDVAIIGMQLEDDYGDLDACPYVDKPSYDALMAAGKKLFLGQQEMFVQQAKDTIAWRERQSYLANQGLIVSQSTMDAMTLARQIALNDNPLNFIQYIAGLSEQAKDEFERLTGYDPDEYEDLAYAHRTILPDDIDPNLLAYAGDMLHAASLGSDVSSGGLRTTQKLALARTAIANTSDADLMETAMGWRHTTQDIVRGNGEKLHGDTIVGKVFASLYGDAFLNDQAFYNRLAIIERIFGISALYLHTQTMSARAKRNADLLFEGLERVAERFGYGDIFSPTTTAQPQLAITSLSVNGTTYSTGSVRVAWDTFAIDEDNILKIALYPMHADGQTQLSEDPLADNINDRTFVDVPLDAFNRSGAQKIKIVIYYNDGRNAVGKVLSSSINIQPSGTSDIDLPEGLTEEELNILDFGEVPNSLMGNHAILNYLVDYFAGGTGDRLQQVGNENRWQGAIHGTDQMECKEWLDEIVIKEATDVNIPAIEAVGQSVAYGSTGRWDETNLNSVSIVGDRVENIGEFQDRFNSNNVQSGDVVQMYGNFGRSIPHTMVVGKIETDGIWVFDTNFGSLGEYMETTDVNKANLMANPNSPSNFISAVEAQALNISFTPTHYYQSDNTVRYHKLAFTSLNASVQKATFYRINI